jgi:predicted metalloprotease
LIRSPALRWSVSSPIALAAVRPSCISPGSIRLRFFPAQMLGGLEQTQQTTAGGQSRQAGQTPEEVCNRGEYALEACNALDSLDKTWEPIFQRANVRFQKPFLDLYQNGSVNSACGNATSAAGPFYCPADEGIYIDTKFFDTMSRQLGAKGDFARYYVIAHEYGHHIQKLTGVAAQIRSLQQQRPRVSNQLQVLMELQADCYAGVWAGKNRNLIEPGDMQEGLTAASAIGDDTLQRNAGQRINPEGFTHGTSQQRMQALRLGLDSADDTQCDRIVEMN